jgi:hypothetical protein
MRTGKREAGVAQPAESGEASKPPHSIKFVQFNPDNAVGSGEIMISSAVAGQAGVTAINFYGPYCIRIDIKGRTFIVPWSSVKFAELA